MNNGEFEEKLLTGSLDNLDELKRWLFEENIRLSLKQKEIEEIREKYIKEREDVQKDLNAIHLKVVRERQRLKDEEAFFAKKMEILKNGFADLESDRKKLERDKLAFESEKRAHSSYQTSAVYESLAGSLFAGVNNLLALKKRYRDLLKIFHPDNLCGDHEMVTIITREYERLKSDIEFSFRNVN